MRLKALLLGMSIGAAAVVGFFGGSIDTSAPGWIELQQAEARAYRRSVRRTSRRMYRRHHYYGGGGYYGGGAAVGAAIIVGSMVATLPPSCTIIVVNGMSYHNCAGTYYVPSGTQYVIVEGPY